MPSPFPGMDPYIEHHSLWGDFHNNLASQIQAQLNAVIRPNYYARTIPYVTYETLEIGRATKTYPDVSVFQNLPSIKEASIEYATSATVLVEPPMPVESEVPVEEPLTLHFVEVHTAGTDDLVAVIEILSPINNRPGRDGYEKYLRKRQQILNTDTIHLIEIDFLRSGTRPPLLKAVPDASYYILLSRAEARPRVTVWPIQLDDRLPTIPVPLNNPDPDAMLDLDQAIKDVYERCAYDLQINYSEMSSGRLCHPCAGMTRSA